MPDQGDPDDENGSEDAPATGSADEPSADDAGSAATGGGGAGGGTGGAAGGGGGSATGGGGGNNGGGSGGGAAGGSLGSDEQYCSSCGEPIKKEAEICPHCGVRNKSASSGGGSGSSSSGRKDRTTAGILALLLGGIGAHKFYLNDTGLGLLYLCFSWTLIPAIIGFIEGIIYLTKTDEEFERQYVN
jgi:TM2 domain-containing membrane protein YozV